MRKVLSLFLIVLAAAAIAGCAFVTVIGDGNVLETDLFDMSYRTGLPAEKPMPLLDQVHQAVTTRPALERVALPERPVWLTDLLPKKEPATRPATPAPPG